MATGAVDLSVIQAGAVQLSATGGVVGGGEIGPLVVVALETTGRRSTAGQRCPVAGGAIAVWRIHSRTMVIGTQLDGVAGLQIGPFGRAVAGVAARPILPGQGRATMAGATFVFGSDRALSVIGAAFVIGVAGLKGGPFVAMAAIAAWALMGFVAPALKLGSVAFGADLGGWAAMFVSYPTSDRLMLVQAPEVVMAIVATRDISLSL